MNQNIPKTPLAFFWFAIKPSRFWFWLAVFLVIIGAGVWASSSFLFKLIIEAAETNNAHGVVFYGLLYPVVILFVQILYRLSGVACMKSTIKASKVATDSTMEYLMGQTQTYFSNRFAGAITNKVRNVSGALENIIPDILWSQLNAVVSFLVTFVLLWFVDIRISLLFLMLLATLALVNKFLAKEKARLSKINAETGTLLQGGLADVVTNISVVRQYVQKSFELDRLKILTSNKANSSLANWFFTEKLLFYNVVIIFVFAFLMFWLLTNRWSNDAISTGDFIMVIALVSQISSSMLFIGRAFNSIARAVGELREGLDDIFLPYGIVDAVDTKKIAVNQGEIKWHSVNFRFEDKTVFNNFSLTINPEQKIGLVGHSGAGKSTFVSLLLRQHNLSGGAIYIDGQNIAEVTQDSLRQNIAVVPQEPILFHRTISENIAYGNFKASLDDIKRVAQLAKADEFIDELSNGYDTIVGERGVKLSGGQKQRIVIARAMLKNAPILILDEATSALDSESEQFIQEALRELMKGKTVIAIAHRLSTLREMDRIIVLDSGKICEDGNHESLKLAGGVYSRLWAHQAGGFLSE